MSGVSKTPPNSTTKTKNVLVSKRRPLGSSGRTASQESARPMSPKGEKAGGSTGVSRPSTSSRTRPGVVIAEKKSSTSAESSAKVKTENGKPKASPRNNAMSTSMIVKSKEPQSKPRSMMTKSTTESNSKTTSNVMSKSMNCNVENGRQESAELAKKPAERPTISKPKSTRNIPKAAPRIRPGADNVKSSNAAAKSSITTSKTLVHSDHEQDSLEDEPNDEPIHPAILKQSRQTGSLNLSGRELSVIPAKIWTLNDPDENDSKKGLFMDKIDEDRWWDRIDLTKLILASNQISKLSPKIKNLAQSLNVLDLHDNNLSLLPEEIGDLENLNKLNLSHNKLLSLPIRFYDMRNLRNLNLSHNELNELHEDLGQLDMLESFDIAHNKLIELPGLTCLSRITNFNASHNCLESIPHEISFLRSVTCLELSHNSISIIPDSIQDLHNLERLYLQHNKLKAMPVLKNCQHLKEIYVGFNFIEELTDIDLENMPNVKLLDLRDNKIPVLPDEVINLQSLERLDLSNNDLSTLPFTLGTLPHLKSLQVDGNPMKSIRRDIIARGTMGLLKYLKSRIDEDELKRLREKGQVSPVPSVCGSPPIPDKFVMKSAQVMNMTGKELTFLPKEAVENAMEAEVTGVDLSKNYLDKFPPQLEPLMKQLYELNLSSNRLTVLTPSIIGLGCHLQFLNLANNKLEDLPPEVAFLSNLREICLSCNRFEKVPSCIYGCGKLETLIAGDNRISEIDVESLKKLTKLAILDLGNNNIGSVPPELGRLTTIRSLTLDGNAFRVPRPQILMKGTESIMAYLRDRIPRNQEEDEATAATPGVTQP